MVAAAKRVLRSSALESLGLQDKRDMSMLIAQSALQVSGLLYSRPCPWAFHNTTGTSAPVMTLGSVNMSHRHACTPAKDGMSLGPAPRASLGSSAAVSSVSSVSGQQALSPCTLPV